MLGDDLLLAPILTAQAQSVTAALPEGTWIHLFGQQEYEGTEQYEIKAPIGTPAVFIRKESPLLQGLLTIR
jgi:alpha-glucosidase (family GH31 glycosyl hydrolase)